MPLSSEPVLVATSRDALYGEDREKLAQLGFSQCVRFSSGRAILDFVKYNAVRAILVDTEIADMSLPEFVSALRELHPADFLHVLVISEVRDEGFVLSIISAGCSGLVLRPYELTALEKHMVQAGKIAEMRDHDQETVEQAESLIAKGNYEEAIGDLTLVVSQQEDQASGYFFQGCQFLVEKKWSDAIRAFNQSLARNQTFIKAYEGLARAYQGKNDIERYRYYLQKAAEEYARMNNFAKVKKIFVEIVKYDVNAPNPYNTLGIRLRQEKQYKEAIDAYFKAIELSPYDENIHYNMAKAYVCDVQAAKALECIRQALRISSEHFEALRMYQMLTGSDFETDPDAPLLARFAVAG